MLSRSLAIKCGVERLDRLGFKYAFKSKEGELPNIAMILKMHVQMGSETRVRLFKQHGKQKAS